MSSHELIQVFAAEQIYRWMAGEQNTRSFLSRDEE